MTALGLTVQVEPPAPVYGVPIVELRGPGDFGGRDPLLDDPWNGRDPFIGGGFGLGGQRRRFD